LVLVSFDIDGTMTFGDPEGPITVEMVRRAKSLGYIIGSASDRTVSNQKQLWQDAEVELDFVSLKHKLPEVREAMPPAARYLHIGDTDVDAHFAKLAGFEFCFGHEVEENEDWLLPGGGGI
jgi:hydroxymethylpyrimidine pyrophosphatase-like HAD family hydrolase